MKRVVAVLLLILCCVLTAYAAKNITILKTGEEGYDISLQLKELLSNRFEVKVYTIKEPDAFDNVAELNSDLVLFTSPEVGDLFRAYGSSIGSTAILALDNGSFSQQGVRTIARIQAAPDALKELSRLNKSDIKRVGVLYDETHKEAAKSEILFLEKGGYKVTSYDLPDVVDVGAIKAGFNTFSKGNYTHYRILLNGVNRNTIMKNPQLHRFIEEQVSTIIVNDDNDWSVDFPETGIITVRENYQFTASAMALIATTQLEGGLPKDLKTIYINTTISALSMGKVQHYTLGDCGRSAVGAIKIMLGGVDRTMEWKDVDEFLGNYIGVVYKGKKRVVFSHRETVFGNSFIAFIAKVMAHPYYAYGISLLLILVVAAVIFYKVMKSIRDRKLIDSSVLFFPQDLKRLKIESGDKKILLSKVFSKNGYMPIYTSSTIMMQKLIRHYMPDIFVIDWRESNAVNYLRKELSGYSLSSAETVIIFNVPQERVAEMKTAFGRAVTLCFEDVPDMVDLIESLNKKGGSEAEISGRIRKDSLTSMLQVLESQRSSGCLVVEDDSPLSVIYYQNGVIVHAEDRVGNRGEEAIYTGLRCKRGRFFFLNDRPAPTQTTSFNSMEILLSFAERSDTENRHR